MSRLWLAMTLVGILVGFAAVAAGGVGVTWAVWSAAREAQSPPDPARVVWSSSGGEEEPLGSWVSGGSLIVARHSSLTAYRGEDGENVWRVTGRSLSPEGRADALCGMSRGTRDGLGIVAYGTATSDVAVNCTGIALIDLRTGEPIWRRSLPVGPGRGVRAEFVGNAVLASWDGHFLAARAGDGGEIWRWSVPEGCHPSGPALGRTVVVPVRCASGRKYLQLLGAADGSRRGAADLGGVAGRSVAISTDPPAVVDDTARPGRVLLFDESARRTGVLEVEGPKGSLDVLPANAPRPGFPRRFPFVIGDGILTGTVAEGRFITTADLRRDDRGPVRPGEGRGTRPIGRTGEGVVFAGSGDVGVFTYGSRGREVELGRISEVAPRGDDLHWVGGVLYGVSTEDPQMYAVRSARP